MMHLFLVFFFVECNFFVAVVAVCWADCLLLR